MTMQHNWRILVSSNDPRHMVRGTELETSIPAGFMSRLAIYSVRTVDRDPTFKFEHVYNYDRRFIVRDANTVSDAQLKDGKRPDIIASFATEAELDAWLERQRELISAKESAISR